MVFDTISHGYLSVGKDYHMNEHDQKHLTLSNRTYIEQELLQKSTFSSIGSVLHKDPSTISKEVKRYSKTIPARYSYKCNLCKHYKDCDLRSKELKCPRYSSHCSFYCKKCYRRTVIDYCPYFLPYKCNKINKPPYVCNYCEDYKSCPLDKKVYDAAYAQRQYEKKLYNSRKCINMTHEELQELNDLISPLILKGRLEKNHEYIRYVIPKGRSMYRYTQDDINLMFSHINSTARDSLNGATPFDLADLLLDKKIPALAGQFKVSPDEVMLKPALIEMSVKEREANHE